MLTGVFQSAVVLLTGLAYYLVDSLLIRHYDQLRAEEGSGRSWRYTAFMIGFLGLLVVQPVLFPGMGLHIQARWGLWIQGAGMVLIAGAFALHWWARTHLQQFYVEDVLFQEGQHLVNTGPYRLVRHPVFTSFFVISAGLLLVNPAATTLLLALYVAADFSQAARKEEELLAEALPEYASYMKHTGRFLPKWR